MPVHFPFWRKPKYMHISFNQTQLYIKNNSDLKTVLQNTLGKSYHNGLEVLLNGKVQHPRDWSGIVLHDGDKVLITKT